MCGVSRERLHVRKYSPPSDVVLRVPGAGRMCVQHGVLVCSTKARVQVPGAMDRYVFRVVTGEVATVLD